MKIKFSPYDFETKIKAKSTYIYLYGKLRDNTKICVVQAFQPYFYIKTKGIDLEKLEQRLTNIELKPSAESIETAKVVSWEEVKKALLGKEELFWKIYVNSPRATYLISKELEKEGVDCYETDLPPIHRYLRDQNLTTMSLMQVQGKYSDTFDTKMQVPVFLASSITQESKKADTQNLKIMGLDIETYTKNKSIDPENDPILMVALYGVNEQGEEYKKVLTWKQFNHNLDYMEHFETEETLLQKFRQIIKEYQPDIITGYFSDGFDFPYIKKRADKLGIKLDLGLDGSELHTGNHDFKDNLRYGKSKINGILHLDVYQFIRKIFGKNLKIDSYSLDTVAGELLDNKKHNVELDHLPNAWDNNESKQLTDFCEYNLHDAHLALKLCQKLMYDMVEFSKIVGLPLYDVTRMSFSRLVENYILKRAVEFNVIAPNKPKNVDIEQRSEETFKGGFVFEPVPGLYKDLVVFDFRSLYPTIISAHNIGPEGLCCNCCSNKKEKVKEKEKGKVKGRKKVKENKKSQVPNQEDLWFCTKEKKFMPQVLEQIVLRRTDLKQLIKDTAKKGKGTKFLESRSYALKILANSFYGYMGFFGARWYCLECVKAVTSYARNYITTTIEKAQKKGFKVVYGDTDSVFFLLENKTVKDAKNFMDEINSTLPGHMELEFEGHFPRGLFVAQKGTDKGAKKKYALIDGKGKMKITGFETVRRNWSQISKEVQEHVLKLVLQDKTEEALEYVKEMIQKLKNGQIDLKKLILKTQITKDLASYSSIGPHVAVALRMLEKGAPVSAGTVVEYVIAKGSGLIREKAKLVEEIKEGEYDTDYYLNNQIIPAISSIFAVLGYKEDEFTKDSSQQGLGGFF